MEASAETVALCLEAARGLAGAAGTDLWTQLRSSIVRMFGRRGTDDEARQSARLEQDHRELETAPESDRERLESAVAQRWSTRLTDLIEEYPDLRDELTSIVEAVRASNVESGTKFSNVTAVADRFGQNIFSGRDINFGRG